MGGVSARRPDWDRLAAAYDWQLPLERPALRALLGLLDVREDERLLDAGTGTGALLRELARQGQPRQAVGLDRSATMLARARPLLPPGWELVRGDAERMPFDDASFDVVAAAYLLHILDANQRARVLGELHRVLKPSGQGGRRHGRAAALEGRLVARITDPRRGQAPRGSPRRPPPARSPLRARRIRISRHRISPDPTRLPVSMRARQALNPRPRMRVESVESPCNSRNRTANRGGSRWTPTRAQRPPDGLRRRGSQREAGGSRRIDPASDSGFARWASTT